MYNPDLLLQLIAKGWIQWFRINEVKGNPQYHVLFGNKFGSDYDKQPQTLSINHLGVHTFDKIIPILLKLLRTKYQEHIKKKQKIINEMIIKQEKLEQLIKDCTINYTMSNPQ